jgi:hypothetical protein
VRACVCGPRNWTDAWPIVCALTIIRAEWEAGRSMGDWPDRDLPTLVHGAARGADSMAAALAGDGGFLIEAHPADWERHGKASGHIRNREMLQSGLDLVIGVAPRTGLTIGTKNMIGASRSAGVRTLVLVP